jgi:hypothetical protein
MIYGLNFNNKPIPGKIGRRFAKRLRLGANLSTKKTIPAILQGVCNTDEERDAMLLQAQTSSRRFYVTPLRKIDGENWMAFYSYHVPVDERDYGKGWPCHSFISSPIFRRYGLGKDIQINKAGIVLRKMTKGKTVYIQRTWLQLFHLPGKTRYEI